MFDYLVIDRVDAVTLQPGLVIVVDPKTVVAAARGAEAQEKAQLAVDAALRLRAPQHVYDVLAPIELFAGVQFGCARDLTLEFGDRLALAAEPALGLAARREAARKADIGRSSAGIGGTPGVKARGAPADSSRPVRSVAIPSGWRDLPWPELQHLASKFSERPVRTKDEARAVVEAELASMPQAAE
jgi:hypothetical protein